MRQVARTGNLEMLRLFLVAAKEPSESMYVFHERDITAGCDLLHFACQECGYSVIAEILPFYRGEDLGSQAGNGDTCLHSLTLNRHTTLVCAPGFELRYRLRSRNWCGRY